MWTFLITGLLAAVLIVQTPDLDALRWNNRVLLLFAPNLNDDRLTQQKQALDNQASGVQERDMKVFAVASHSQADEQLRNKFHVKPDSFAVVLVGKDGSQKLKRSEPVDPQTIFGLIDSMPMRKNEMRQRQ
jgi:hypothetical protein